MKTPNPIYRYILSLEGQAFMDACADIIANLPEDIISAFRSGRVQDNLNKHDADKKDWLPFKTARRLIDLALASGCCYLDSQSLNCDPIHESFLFLYDTIRRGRGLPDRTVMSGKIKADIIVIDDEKKTISFHCFPKDIREMIEKDFFDPGIHERMEEFIYGTLDYSVSGTTWMTTDSEKGFTIKMDI